MGYIFFTFHYLDDRLELKNRVLCLKFLTDSHSSDYLRDKIFEKELSNMTNIVKIVFTVTATSVPAESLFSDAGLIQNDLRNRLDPAILDKINFVKSNNFS